MADEFNWRDYVTISPVGMTHDQLGAIEKAMDSIAAAADNEGQDLIRRAAEKNGGKITIASEGEKSSASLAGKINIDFDEISRVVFETPNGRVHPSLTGALVHEIYHTADPELSRTTEMFKFLPEILSSYGIPADEAQRAAELYRQAAIDPARAKSLDDDLQRNCPSVTAAYDKGTLDVDTLELIASKKAGLLNAEGIAYIEARAAEYTDAFMQKNFGPAEPQRGQYTNGKLAAPTPVQAKTRSAFDDPPPPGIHLPKSLGVFGTPGFNPQGPEGQDNGPTIRPSDPRDYPIPTNRVGNPLFDGALRGVNLSGLSGVSGPPSSVEAEAASQIVASVRPKASVTVA